MMTAKWRVVLCTLVLNLSTYCLGAEPLQLLKEVSVGLGAHQLRIRSGKETVYRVSVKRQFDVSDGFPEALVQAFAQDEAGVIWMATDRGLLSFDGCLLRHYDTADTLDGNSVEVINLDGAEQIWFAANNGVVVIDVARNQIERPLLPANTDVRCLAVDHASRPIVGTKSGLLVWQNQNFERVPGDIVGKEVNCAEADQNREVTWIGTNNGLFVLTDGHIQRAENEGVSKVAVTALHVDRHGLLWVGTKTSLLRIDSNGSTIAVREKGKRNIAVDCFSEGRIGSIWFSTEQTENFITKASAQGDAPKVSRMLRTPSSSMFADRDGHQWRGTAKREVMFYYSDLRQLTAERCMHVVNVPSDKSIWFTFRRQHGQDLELARLNDKHLSTWSNIPAETTSLHWYDQHLLLATDNGLVRFKDGQTTPFPVEALRSGPIHAVAVDKQNVLWVTSSDGLIRVKDNEIQSRGPKVPNLRDEPLRHIVPYGDDGDEYVLATSQRIYYYKEGELKRELDFSQELDDRRIHDVLRTENGELWVGSTHGLFRQANPAAKLIQVGPANQVIGTFLAQGNRGHIWAGSLPGLWRIDPATEIMQVMLPEDGTGPGPIWRCCATGRLTYLATRQGLFQFDDRSNTPRLLIDRITTDREIATFDQVGMTTDEPLLNLEFHAITPTLRNGSTLYRHRLTGHEDDDEGEWSVPYREPRLELQNLRAGSYELELQAFDRNLRPSKILTIPVRVSLPIMRYASNAALLILGSCLIGGIVYTFRKQRRQNKDLSDQVAASVDEQLKLSAELEHSQKLDALGTLAAGMAHDFNNSLQVIHASSELAQVAQDPQEVQKLVADVKVASEQAAKLTKSMLSLAQKGPNDSKATCLGKLLHDCIEMMERAFPANISIVADIAQPDLWASLDSDQIRQAIVNLMVNARDAMPQGGELFVGLHEDVNSENLVITIRDTGNGISESDINRIFEPFFSTKSRGKGTGLGLTMTHRTITAHDGTISVDSSPEAGTRFHIRLPACTRPVMTARIDESHSPMLASREYVHSVLIVDDQAAVRNILRDQLKLHGCQVQEAENGVAGLEAALSGSFDAIILDIDLPKLDGIEVARRLRQSGDDTQVVLITGGSASIRTQANMVLLHKPFAVEDLLAAAFPDDSQSHTV